MIKKIYFFGTSHTAGGGFEFDSTLKHNLGEENSKNIDLNRGEYIKKIYKELFPEEKQTQENYSYVGQFRNLLKEKSIDIEVINISKQGYGNDRIFRKFFKIVNDKNFNKNNTLFVFEFSDIERKEVWYNELNSHIILNYSITKRNMNNKVIKVFEKPDKNNLSIAKTYWYENKEDLIKIKNDFNFFKELLLKTTNGNIEVDLFKNKLVSFLSFIKLNNINFLVTELPNLIESDKFISFVNKHRIQFGDYKNLIEFIFKNKLLILSETEEKYTDLHASLTANKIISKFIYNECVDRKYIQHKKINIDKSDYLFPKIKKTNIM